VTPAFAQAKLPHRLDFGTSGVMVVGLNPESTQHLNKQFQAGKIQKRYLAMLEGWLGDDHGQITAPIAKHKSDFPKVKICLIKGKTAISEFKVLQRLEHPRRSLVEFTPVTGRTHQLRIHSLTMGHPIIGCDLYKNQHSEQMATRMLLHASEINFEHPTSAEKFQGYCTCPF
jgi:tRNA pseudouridine32 synthase/23S rRNA pseudouridine746 synthase